ncbi:hypothetical protein MMC18_006501 [Xylographa bjoerkii]|nr:hypothetical protein [Xylographa bjoerkii]
MTSAIGPFAINSSFISSASGLKTIVRIHNTNTGNLINATFPVFEGQAVADGDFAIDGVSGTGAKIELAFVNPAGSKTGMLLPTGNAVEVFDGVPATCIDVANPCVFVQANNFSIPGSILPEALEAHPTLLARLDRIRRQASAAMGLSTDEASTPPSTPKIAMISSPSSHPLVSGQTLSESSVDLVIRAISVGQPHRAVPITVALAIASAAKVKGSLVESMMRNQDSVHPDGLTLGHASGTL